MKSLHKKSKRSMKKTVLLIATFDTKEEEALFLKKEIEARGIHVLTMDTGILAPPHSKVDIDQNQVALRGGILLKEVVATGDKGKCILNMIVGAKEITQEFYKEGKFSAVIGFGGAQGTEMACAAMRALPTGVPKLVVSTVASGNAIFGPYVGTKDITLMHSVADMQGVNFLTKRILKNAAGAICGMMENLEEKLLKPEKIPVAMSMLGTTTPGALRCKGILEANGFEVVTFHQNGTGGIAMEDMIRERAFQGVLDLNLHEIGDRFVGGLHSAIREDRLEAAGALGIPQIVAPGSINYVVLGPLDSLSAEWRSRKLVVHNPNLTLVRLSANELQGVGRIVAEKLNRAKGPTHFFIPLRGFSYPDRENHPHWDPEGNRAFIDSLKASLNQSISLTELDAHINDPEFVDPVTEVFLSTMRGFKGAKHV
ncbi:MAG TPA: Tm-1-like ATP-binding domain-containing protein [Thermodesulfobacteriota bacterium]|nr:Tm-1-like ATP-binding domain-containing protein [Thermodesulfobacteriota bacterium]